MQGIYLLLRYLVLALAWSASAVVQAQTPAEPQPLCVGETFTLASKVLGEIRRINVYLPPAYAADPRVRLPVLYMPDGGLGEDFLHVAGLVQVLTANATMRPFILVGIENTQRRRDLTGPTESEEDKRIAPQVGASADFRAFLRLELFPLIQERYRTTGERAIVGESLAGLFVVETFFLEPDLFDAYLAFDPSLWWNHQALVGEAGRRLEVATATSKTLYFASSGEPSLVPITQRLADVLAHCSPAQVHWHYEPMAQESHATIYHPAALRAFRTVFAPTYRH